MNAKLVVVITILVLAVMTAGSTAYRSFCAEAGSAELGPASSTGTVDEGGAVASGVTSQGELLPPPPGFADGAAGASL